MLADVALVVQFMVPSDYYTFEVGALVDAYVLTSILMEVDPELCAHFYSFGGCGTTTTSLGTKRLQL